MIRLSVRFLYSSFLYIEYSSHKYTIYRVYLCVVIVLLLLRNDGNIQSPKAKEKPKATEDIMNTKTARQIEEMKKQTIGVEVEMNNITRNKAAKIAAKFFGTGRFENTADRNSYCTWSAYDEQGREWKFQKDVSITGPDSEKCEMVTPILTYADIETLQELVRRLRKAGAKSDSTRGCGVHIHIGAKGHTAQPLETLQTLWQATNSF